jgi:membrane-associated phospholipid phosphatase
LSRLDLRVEDVLTALTALVLLFVAGFRSFGRMKLDEGNYWDFAFILLPLALLVLREALAYAFRPIGSAKSVQVGGKAGRLVRDWLPFLLFLLLYETFRVNTWNYVSPVDCDALLLQWDRRLFGETPSVLLDRFASPSLTGVLTIAYALHLVLPPILALIWYRRDLRTFRELLLVILLTAVFGSLGYLAVPAIGPGFAFPNLYKNSLSGNLYENVTGLMDAARALRDVFPSLHVAISSIVLYYSWRRGRALFAVMLPLVIANWVSTVYLRYHYLIDVFAGWLTAVLSIASARVLLSVEDRIRKRAVRVETVPAA